LPNPILQLLLLAKRSLWRINLFLFPTIDRSINFMLLAPCSFLRSTH